MAQKFPRGCERAWMWAHVAVALIGIALRMLVAVRHHQLIHPDEHFQTLEIAHRLVTGVGWKSWEWYHGTRSWCVPALYATVIMGLRVIGFLTPSLLISACRVFTALGVIVATWILLRVARKISASYAMHPLALFIVAAGIWLLPEWIRYSPATLSDTWGFVCVCGTLAYVWATPADTTTSRARIFFGGVLLGLTFWIRIQLLAWALPLLTLWIWRTSRRTMLLACGGFCAMVVAHGVLDLFTWGHFFHSTIANVQFNIFKGVAASNGVEPASYYFTMLLRDNMWLAAGATAALVLPALWRDAQWRMIALPGLAFFAAHLCIAHKEERFLLPMWPLLALLSLICWQHLIALWRESQVWRWFPGIIIATLLMLIGTSARDAWRGDAYPYGPGVTLTERAAVLHWDRRNVDPPCVILVDHYWVWTRGEMGLGRHVDLRELSVPTIRPQDFEECTAALVGEGAIAPFANIAQTHGWRMCARDGRNNALWCAPHVDDDFFIPSPFGGGPGRGSH